MINESIKSLIDSMRKIPGIGSKSAENIIFYILQNRAIAEDISDSLKSALIHIKSCKQCHNFSEKDICKICESRSSSKTVCVVHDVRDLVKIEKTKIFDGKYHILSGKLDPIQGVEPKDLNISTLINRVNSGEIEEIILALDCDSEGEITSEYIIDKLKNSAKITKIANGIPIGGKVLGVDAISLKESFNNRTSI